MASYLVTGASRGLGLSLVARLASQSNDKVGIIFAACRGDAPALKKLSNTYAGRIEMIHLDLLNQKSIKDAFVVVERSLQGKGLDFLINNAGVADWSPSGLEGMQNLEEIFKVNVNATHLVSQSSLPLLSKGTHKTVINISSTLGSIALADSFRDLKAPAYKISKAALNMLTKQYALAYAEEGFTFLAINPGWLRTEMGGSQADLDIDVGAKGVIDIAQNASPKQNGKFLNIYVPSGYDGEEIYW